MFESPLNSMPVSRTVWLPLSNDMRTQFPMLSGANVPTEPGLRPRRQESDVAISAGVFLLTMDKPQRLHLHAVRIKDESRSSLTDKRRASGDLH